MKRLFLAIGSLALVALLGVTMVGRPAVDAQDSATPETSGTPAVGGNTSTDEKESIEDTYLATLAEKLGVTTEQLQTVIDQTNEELGIDGMLGNGPRHTHHGGPGGGDGANMTPDRGGNTMRAIDLAGAATFLGLTEDELKSELESGKTFLGIATEQGKTDDEVRAFLIQQATVAIDERLQEAESDAPASSDATEVPAAPTMTPTVTA